MSPRDPHLPDNLDEVTPATCWNSYRACAIPPEVPADDFGLQQCHAAFLAGYASAILLWNELERRGDAERRTRNAARIKQACFDEALQMTDARGTS